TRCYAWVLMTNHAHFLFRSGPAGLSTLMRRLLTGYAVSFNRRHKRHGLLFQNRYKSIICQEDAYLKELVRYIHLNPIRAKMVSDLQSLKKYKFCGHGMLTGHKGQAWQDADYVLKYFASDLKTARRKYLLYVRAGLDQGRRSELVGGGLVRSLGGWTEVKKKRRMGMGRIKGDQRILGDTTFVQTMLKQVNEKYERGYELKAQGVDLDYIAKKTAGIYDIEPDEIYSKGRQQHRADARGLFCFWAVRELNVSLSELARRLMMTPAGVGYAVQRGKSIVRHYGYSLLK
ncbi:MAG: transposase, partial [Desulfobacteraceae bacterium]|nr:transposase [Desulfobacteraceae bacterium]MBC2755855.1 transposase [Desulfobacteraceae bacterium]